MIKMRESTRRLPATLAAASVGLLLAAPAWAGQILFVDDDAPPGGDGQSWTTAFRHLQDALAAVDGGEIRVAQGVYRPDRSEAEPEGDGDRSAAFYLQDEVTLLGGYAGLGMPDPDERDPAVYESVLSGDLAGDDGPEFSNNDENAFHVVRATNVDASGVIDGFTITAGNAVDAPLEIGAGMRNQNASPTVRDCIFVANEADKGAGMYNHVSSPLVEGCLFLANHAVSSGAGMYNKVNSDPVVTGCTFEANAAGVSGGGMFNSLNQPTIEGCTFTGNSSESSGGGAYNDNSTPAITGCTFAVNVAGVNGGGMYNRSSSPVIEDCRFKENLAASGAGIYFLDEVNNDGEPVVRRCVFDANVAQNRGGGIFNSLARPLILNSLFARNVAETLFGGGIYNTDSTPTILNCTLTENVAGTRGGAIYNRESDVAITNCIAWYNAPSQIWNQQGPILVHYCNVQGGFEGSGNIAEDPLFRNPEDGNYRLSDGSPSLDAGDNTAVPDDVEIDLSGAPRFVDDPEAPDIGFGDPPLVDMGAYEKQPPCVGDINEDRFVDAADLVLLNAAWGDCDGCPEDLNDDGVVNVFDVIILLGAWGPCP